MSQYPTATTLNAADYFPFLNVTDVSVSTTGKLNKISVADMATYFGMNSFNPQYTIFFAVGGNDVNPGTYDLPLATLGQAVINAEALITGGASAVSIQGLGVGFDASNVNITKSGIDIFAPGFQLNPAIGDAITVNLAGGPTASYINVLLGSSSVTGGANVVNLIGTTGGHSSVTRFTMMGGSFGNVFLNVQAEYYTTIITGTLTANASLTLVVTQYGIGSQTQQTRLNLRGLLSGGAGSTISGPIQTTNVWRYPMRQIRQLSGNITLNADISGYLFVNSTANPYTITLPDTAGQGTPPFLIGYEATFLNLSSGSISFVAAGASTLIGASIINKVAQRVNCTLTVANTWEVDNNLTGAPNGIQIFVSQAIGNDLNSGSYTNPLATFSAALTLAGAPPPTQPVIIIGLDGNQYNEQLVINNPNVYIAAPFSQITWGGAGDTLTINASGSGTLLDIASVANTAAGNAIVNNVDETVIAKFLILSQGNIVNNGIGNIILESELITVNITNPGGGNVFYDAAIRIGTDGPGVFGINAAGSTAPQFAVNALTTTATASDTVNGFYTATAPSPLINFTNLAAAGQVNIIASPTVTAQYIIVQIAVNGSSAINFDLVGDRDLVITDGTHIWTTIPAAILQAISGNNAFWGSVYIPANGAFPSQNSAAGTNIYAQYANGTTDYTAGELSFQLTYARTTT